MGSNAANGPARPDWQTLFDVARDWCRDGGRDCSETGGISLGWSQQVDLFEDLFPVAAGTKPGWRSVLRRAGLAWTARYWASRAWALAQPWTGEPGAVALVYDVDNRSMTVNLNAVAGELLARGQRVVGVVADPAVRRQLAAGIEPAYFSAFAAAGRRAGPSRAELEACAARLVGALRRSGWGSFAERRRAAVRLLRSLRQAVRDLAALEALLDAGRFVALVSGCDLHRLSALALQVGRQRGLPTFAIQHGIPILPHAYVPPLAETVCVWGEASRSWFAGAGVAAERLLVTGCPRYDGHQRRGAPVGPSRERPTLVLLSTAIVVERLEPMVDAFLRLPFELFGEVVVKLHPSESTQAFYQDKLVAHGRAAAVRIEQARPIPELLRPGDVVVVGSSSSGVEAVLAGAAVVDVALDGLPSPIDYQAYGVGARAEPAGLAVAFAELQRAWTALPEAERAARRARFLDAHLGFGGGPAAPRIADAILAAVERRPLSPAGVNG